MAGWRARTMTITHDRLARNASEDAGASDGVMMRVCKRNGDLEPVDVNKVMRVATRTISGLCDGATTEELDELSIRTAASLIVEEPNYSKLAARLLSTYIEKEVKNQDIYSFSQSIALGHRLGLVADYVLEL